MGNGRKSLASIPHLPADVSLEPGGISSQDGKSKQENPAATTNMLGTYIPHHWGLQSSQALSPAV